MNAQGGRTDRQAGGHRVSRRWDAVVAGHICLDLIPDLSRVDRASLTALLRPGQLVEVGAASISTGGAVSNTGLALHKLGIQSRLMGKIGDDILGRVVEQVVEAHGPGLSGGMVVDPSSDTSYTVIISPPGVDRVFLHAPAANCSFGAADVRYDEVAQARLFHFGYPPLMRRTFVNTGAELVDMFATCIPWGSTSLDMALPVPPRGR